MFNNLFDSFDKTVGKAKKEREQLDRLLTISTPGELALVALTALVLIAFLAWLLFGSVARSVTLEGVLVEPGEQLAEDRPPLEAVVWLEPEMARQITVGLPALLEVTMTDGEAHSLEGSVAAVVSVPLSAGLEPLGSASPVSMNRVRIALDDGIAFASIDGAKCRIAVEIDRQSPFAFFARGRH